VAFPPGAGVHGFNRWSSINRGDLDGQGQFIETWYPTANRLLAQCTPHPNTYFRPADLLSRFKAKHSAVLDTGFRYPLSVSEIVGVWFFRHCHVWSVRG